MATCTAEFIFGETDMNQVGIGFGHRLCVYENSRMVLVFEKRPTMDEGGDIVDRWVPNPKRILEDCMVMASAYALEDESTLELLKEVLKGRQEGEYVDLSEVDETCMSKLDEATKTAFRKSAMDTKKRGIRRWKVVASLLRNSDVANFICKLHNYEIDIEVCKAVYQYEYSQWTQKVEKWGEL